MNDDSHDAAGRGTGPRPGEPAFTASPARRRSALIAIILSGLGPGAGHAYVGRPRRGALLVLALAAASAAWIVAIPVSYSAARLFSFPPMILVLAVIVDSARLARSTAPAPLRPFQRWWVYAVVVLVTGFLAPTAATPALHARVSLVMAPDDAMDPKVQEGDWVVVARGGLAGLSRGDVVAVSRAGRAPLLRRLVGLPGEVVSVRRGVAEVEGAVLPAVLARPLFAQDLDLAPGRLAESEVLVLGDRRDRSEAPSARVAAGDLLGRASWILLPADHDFIRLGAKP